MRESHVMPHWSKCLARWTLKYHFHWSISWFLEDTSKDASSSAGLKKHYVVNSINPHDSPVQIFVIIKYRQSILIPTKLNLSKSLLIMVVTRYNRISWSWLFNLLKYHHHQVSQHWLSLVHHWINKLRWTYHFSMIYQLKSHPNSPKKKS